MRLPQKKFFKIFLILFLITGGFLFVQTVFAQFGVNEVGEEIVLPSEDPRIVAARIIRVALGFLGIIAVVIVLYGGFVWMTAGGNEERLAKAKKILTSGLIGLVIIVMAFGIASFVINRLMEATGMVPGAGPPGGPGGPPGGLPSDAFVVRSIQPVGTIPIRNVVVRVVFSRDVEETSLIENFTVKKSSDSSLVSGTTNVSGSVVEFTPTDSCPPPNTDRFCFEADTEFVVEVTTEVRSIDGKSLICGGLARSCRETFTTGNLVDVTGPLVAVTYPDPGQSVPDGSLFTVQTHATDDAGIAYLEYFADGSGDPWDPNNVDTPSTLSTDFYSSRDWDTAGLTLLSRPILTSRAFDIDTNNTTSDGVEVIVRAAHCFNRVKDADEDNVDCGGADCGACPGGSCTTSFDCAPGLSCVGGICLGLPTILDVLPSDGAPGNYITIYGQNFGATAGRVFFGDTRASLPASCLASATWQDNQIIIEVPDMPTGDVPIRVEAQAPDPLPAGTSADDYIDRTDDDGRGPLLPDFRVNDVSRPGICAVSPVEGAPDTPVAVSGAQFGSSQGTSTIAFGGIGAGTATSWSDAVINVNVPRDPSGNAPVQVTVGGENSNPFNFNILAVAEPPRILRFEPASGPVGEYVTIFGSNFGYEPGTVKFKDATGVDVVAGIDFPAACGTNWWKNDTVVVKVPERAATNILTLTTSGGLSDDTSDLSPSQFSVTSGTPKPGICLLDPDNGPTDFSPVNIYGERLGTSGTAKFWENITAVTTAWAEGQIITRVPTGAATGPVNVTVGTQISNSLNFTVGDCRTKPDPKCPGTQECCTFGRYAGVCRDECEAAAGQGHYYWMFSTGTIPIYPRIVENCTGPTGTPPFLTSPAPWSERGQTEVCVNAIVVARFTTLIKWSSLINQSTVLVQKCNGTDPENPCGTSETPALEPALSGTLEKVDSDSQTEFSFLPTSGTRLAQNSWYQVTLKGGTNDAPAHIQSCVGGRGCPEPGFYLDGDEDGREGGDYVFRFKTRNNTDLCEVGYVGAEPYSKTAEEENDLIAYSGSVLDADDVCLKINPADYPWNWSIRDPISPPRLPDRATVVGSRTLDDDGGLITTGVPEHRAVATALYETVPEDDIMIRATIPSPPLSSPKSGEGSLKIDFTDPKITDKWPDCSDACVNAEIGAKFNTQMIHATSGSPNYDKSVLNPLNSKLYIWRCGNGVVEPGEDCDDGNMISGDGCSGSASSLRPCLNEGTFRCDSPTQQNCCGNGRKEIGEDCDGVPFPDRCDSTLCLNTGSDGVAAICGDGAIEDGEDCDGMPLPARCNPGTCLNEGTDDLISVTLGSRGYQSDERTLTLGLVPGADLLASTFYRVVIFGSVASESKVNLTDLNFDDPNDSRTFSDTDFDSYSWTFKTKDDANPCTVDRVDVSPKEATLTYIDATQDYVSTPFSAPDLCSASGQRLRAMDYDWGWSSAYISVATITRENNRPVCGNNILEFGEDCDDGNATLGDGCDASCLNEGSRGTDESRCGNGRVELGEDCDDGNTRPGDGCNSSCLHEGSTAGGSICGDGMVGTGEDCDDGNTIDVPRDGCSRICLNDGTVPDTFFDPYQTATAVGLKDEDIAAHETSSTTEIRAEEMESGEAGAGDLTVTCNYGLQEDGVTFIPCPVLRCTDGYCQRSGRERSSVTCSSDLDCELSVGRDTCCHFKPKVASCSPTRGSAESCTSGKTGVCRNAKVSVTFNQLMDPTSVTGNLLVIGNYPRSSPCPAGTTPLADLGTWGEKFALQMKKQSWFATILQILRPLKSISPIKFIDIFFGHEVLAQVTPPRTNDWCVWPGTASSITVRSGTNTVTKVSFSPTKAFDPTKEYRVLVLGDDPYTFDIVEGLKSLKGASLGGASVRSDLAGTRTIGGKEIYEWIFETSAEVCYLARAEVSPNFKLFQRSGETQDFEVVARDVRGDEIESLPDVYAWEWNWDKGGENPTVINLSDLITPKQKRAAVPSEDAKNGDARILATAEITADTIFTPGTAGRRVTGSADVTVFLCENPWPSDFGTSEGLKDLNYNFKSFYCRDRGVGGEDDDLPIFGGRAGEPELPVINDPDAAGRTETKDDLLREYFLFNQGKYCTLSKLPCQTSGDCTMADESCQPSSDVIGIRIYENVEHLNLTDWYLAQGFRHGAPAAKTIDDYEAIVDGRTIYVAAANKSSSLYTNVYLISYNDGAGDDTMNIYDQLVKNWKFNINLENNKLCKDPGPDAMAGTSDDGDFVERDGQNIFCTSDADCPVITVALDGGRTLQSLCDAPKDKITRDVKRLIDLKTMKSAIDSYRFSKGYPPKLEAGTFVRGIAPSRWDSWDNVLAGELGAALPTDPLDQFMGCGDAKLCKGDLARPCSTDDDCPIGTGPCQEYKFDSGTCWSTDAQIYRCPAGSHIYQYIFNPRTGNYEIGTDFEYWEGPGIRPSYSWFTAVGKPIPPYVRYEDTCSASAIYANTGICGDGTINVAAGEECEIGDTREDTCETAEGAAGRKSRSCDIATCRWGSWSGCLSNCGNGILEPPVEECDRGPGGGRIPGGGTSIDNPYECGRDCRFMRRTPTGPPEWCGDGIIQTAYGEVCDDGSWNGGSGKACRDSSGRLVRPTAPLFCMSDDDCSGSNTCQPYCDIDCVGSGSFCGDRIVDSTREDCDGGTKTTRGLCYGFGGLERPADTDDHVINPFPCESDEDCPTGGTCALCSPADGGYPQSRASNCLPPGHVSECRWSSWSRCNPSGECGNGIREGDEECDDGNTNNNDGCIITNRGGTFNKGTNKSQWNCTNAICGDGFTRTGRETCDSGDRNNVPCTAAYGSTCNFCTNECTLRTVTGPFCGDGVRNGAEICDGTDFGGTPLEGWTSDSVCVDCRQMCPPNYLARQIYFAGGRPSIYLASGAPTTITLPACRLLESIKADISLRGIELSPINIVFEIGATARTSDKLDGLKSAIRSVIEDLADTSEPERFNIKIVETTNSNGVRDSGRGRERQSEFLNLDRQRVTLDDWIDAMGTPASSPPLGTGDLPLLPYKDELAGRSGDKFVIFIANRTQLMFTVPDPPDSTWSPKHRVFDIDASHNLPENIESAKRAGIKIYTILWSANTNQDTTVADIGGERQTWERVVIPKRPVGGMVGDSCGTEFSPDCEMETVTGVVPVDYDINDFEIWSSKCSLKSGGAIIGYEGDYSCRPAEGTPGFYKECYTCSTEAEDAKYYQRATSSLSSVLGRVINYITDVALTLEIAVGGGESRLPVQTRDLEEEVEFLIYDPSSRKGDQECATEPTTGQTQQVPIRVNFSGEGTVFIKNLKVNMCPGPPYPTPVYELDWCTLNPEMCEGFWGGAGLPGGLPGGGLP